MAGTAIPTADRDRWRAARIHAFFNAISPRNFRGQFKPARTSLRARCGGLVIRRGADGGWKAIDPAIGLPRTRVSNVSHQIFFPDISQPGHSTRETGGLSTVGVGAARVSGSTREIRRSAAHVAYFPTTPGMPNGCATSRGSTFPPPAICGCDGSKPSRNSRLNTSERAIRKASFRLLARRSAALKKASPK